MEFVLLQTLWTLKWTLGKEQQEATHTSQQSFLSGGTSGSRPTQSSDFQQLPHHIAWQWLGCCSRCHNSNSVVVVVLLPPRCVPPRPIAAFLGNGQGVNGRWSAWISPPVSSDAGPSRRSIQRGSVLRGPRRSSLSDVGTVARAMTWPKWQCPTPAY